MPEAAAQEDYGLEFLPVLQPRQSALLREAVGHRRGPTDTGACRQARAEAAHVPGTTAEPLQKRPPMTRSARSSTSPNSPFLPSVLASQAVTTTRACRSWQDTGRAVRSVPCFYCASFSSGRQTGTSAPPAAEQKPAEPALAGHKPGAATTLAAAHAAAGRTPGAGASPGKATSAAKDGGRGAAPQAPATLARCRRLQQPKAQTLRRPVLALCQKLRSPKSGSWQPTRGCLAASAPKRASGHVSKISAEQRTARLLQVDAPAFVTGPVWGCVWRESLVTDYSFGKSYFWECFASAQCMCCFASPTRATTHACEARPFTGIPLPD